MAPDIGQSCNVVLIPNIEIYALPTGDLLQQKNPTCWVDTYEGGLSCCHHKNVLLDKDQEQPSDLLTYHLKFRFYFQAYEPEIETSPASLVVPKPASHQNLIRLYFQTEAWAGEYDVPKVSGIPNVNRKAGL